jgi:hypothetical protein
MKKYALFLLLVLFSASLTMAQSSKSKSKSKKKDSKDSIWKDKLWYGGGVVLGFQGSGGYSVFQFGLAPMVGYKILPWLSAGPRIAPTYISVKGPSNVGTSRANLLDLELGVFTRAKVYEGFYLQGELGSRSSQVPYFGNVGADGKVPKERARRTDYQVGAGYSQSDGGWGTDMTVLYNIAVANDLNNVSESPLTFRFGLTYNF